MSDLQDKVVIITGAAGNLGRAVSKAFAAAGAKVALLDLRDDTLQQAAGALPEDSQPFTCAADLIDTDAVSNAVERVLSHYGRIDCLANIAGGFTMGPPLHQTPDKDWDFMMDLNARTVFNTCRAVVPHMLASGGGRIVNVSARAAREGKAKMGPYCASKAAVITLTETLSAEHRHDNITVNCILPGTIDTPQNRTDMPDADHSKWVPPAALADVVLFLCSPAARCVTGAAVPVYGQT
jgi:NAD(P)-dependent dehydrogenase (short-subunit alcohol dehydrogenase family)